MVLIRRPGEQAWRSPKSSTYPNEEALEVLLATSPELLPAVSASSLVVARQVQTGVGPVDLLGIGVDGSIVVVECKLHANPEIRRAVVGQLFAYASAIWQTPPASFEQAVSARLGRPLLEVVQALAGGDSWDELAFRANLERNLRDGRFRLVVAVDTITDELKRTIEYLNDHTIAEVEVTALEIAYLADDGIEIVVPRTFGTEFVHARSAGRGPVGEAELFGALERSCTPEGVSAVRRLYEWVEPHGGSFAWGYGIAYPSTNAWFVVESHSLCVWSCYARSTTATWDVNFEYLARNGVTTARMADFAAALRTIPGVEARLAGLEAANYRRRPSFPIDAILVKTGAVERILEAIGQLLETEPAN
jgi:hypothetical protein